MSENEIKSLQKLELKLYQSAMSQEYVLKVFSITADYLNVMTPSDYAKMNDVSYNTARSRVVYINPSVRLCALN